MNPWGLSEEELKAKGAEHTAREMCQQPDAWEETLALLQKQESKINAFIKPLLARKDVRIVFTGAGTSAYAGDMAAPYLREQAGLEAFSFATTDIVATPHQFLVRISQLCWCPLPAVVTVQRVLVLMIWLNSWWMRFTR